MATATFDYSAGVGALVRTQQDDQPAVTQVGEGEQGDTETLDAGAPPTEPAASSADDVETLDQGPPPTAAPAAAPAAAAAPAPVYDATTAASPATTYVAPQTNMRTGPVVPPGFGSGRVHVSAGRFGFPVGLDACRVGAVTGRAYVGLDCGDGDDVVGHASSFTDFPFVPEVDFPFEGDEAFFRDSGVFANNDDGSADDVIVAAGRSSNLALDDSTQTSNEATGDSNSRKRDDTASGDGSVSSEQRVRQREPRVRVTSAQSTTSSDAENHNGKTSKKQSGNATASNGQVSQAGKNDRSRHKATAKAQHADKKHKGNGGKGKKHNKHGKGRGHKKR